MFRQTSYDLLRNYKKDGSIFVSASQDLTDVRIPIVINIEAETVQVAAVVKHAESTKKNVRSWLINRDLFFKKAAFADKNVTRLTLPNFPPLYLKSKRLFRELFSKNIWPTVGEHRLSDFYFGIDFCAKIC